MINIIKNLHFLINLVTRVYNLIPAPIFHNIDRIKAFRRVFFYVNFEQIEGDYLEFGVYEGSSMISAFYANKASSKTDGLVIVNNNLPQRHFIGFDSFEEGFKYFDSKDEHENWKEGHLESSYIKTNKRLKKILKSRFNLVRGFVENTLPEIKKNNFKIGNYRLNKIAVIQIDMDLYNPGLAALNFCMPFIQEGTVIIVDNYYNFKSNPTKGEIGAVNEFIKLNNIELTDFGNYGLTGKIFIVSKIII